ncbi:hypothetical protein [Rhizobium rhizogenes]|uniref:Uncharacterized protein n=1 Tax=Rhizobium rhizogenes (strain K84 / ATCC BAA-868) TaxID=311403 RepID=B9JF21_RHIR8|nr:hypothetical protein Arad_2289 [Rhizobium rhizogenes K84]
MRILDIKPIADLGGGSRALAVFDLELNSDMRVYGLKLMESPDGRRIVYAPNGNGGRRLATFSPELAAEISKAANAKFEGHVTANGTNSKG